MEMPSLTIKDHVAVPAAGTEWVVEAFDCDSAALQDRHLIESICECVIDHLQLQVIGIPQVHRFSGPGGVTALYLLSESHLACHTYPEHGFATFNLYCCRDCVDWPWSRELTVRLGAGSVNVRKLTRGRQSADTLVERSDQ